MMLQLLGLVGFGGTISEAQKKKKERTKKRMEKRKGRRRIE